MPTYVYECLACGARCEVFHGMAEAPSVKCASCTLEALKGLGLGRVALGHCTGASAEGAAAAEFGRGFTRVRTASMLCF